MESERTKPSLLLKTTFCLLAIFLLTGTNSGCASIFKQDNLIPGVERPFNKVERAEEIVKEGAKVVTKSALVATLYSIGAIAWGVLESSFESVLDRL